MSLFYHGGAEMTSNPLLRRVLQIVLPHDAGAEGRQGQLCDLEELLAEGDSHDGDTEDTAPEEVADGQLQPGDEEPDDVDEERHRNSGLLAMAAAPW